MTYEDIKLLKKAIKDYRHHHKSAFKDPEKLLQTGLVSDIYDARYVVNHRDAKFYKVEYYIIFKHYPNEVWTDIKGNQFRCKDWNEFKDKILKPFL